METIKKKRFTRAMAFLLAILTVFSMLPVSAMAATGDDGSVTPDIVLDENNDVVTSKRFKATAKSGDTGGATRLDPIYVTSGKGSPKAGTWTTPSTDIYFVRYTLARIEGDDIIRDASYGNESLMSSDWSDLADAAINNVKWTISVNAGMDGNPDPFKTTSGMPKFTTTTNALEYERILRNAGSFKNAREALREYLYGTDGDGHLMLDPQKFNYFSENGYSGGMPNFIGVASGTDGMSKLFAGSATPRNVNGAHVLDADMTKTGAVGDKLLAHFYDIADNSQRSQMRLDARENLRNQKKTVDEIDDIMSKAGSAEIANLAFSCTGSGFCYRVIAEPGCVRTNDYNASTVDNFGAYTFRDLITIAYLEATHPDDPRSPHDSSGISALCSGIANTGVAMTPTKNELLMAHYDTNGKIDNVYDSASGTVASPFPNSDSRKTRGSDVKIEGTLTSGRKIYDEVIGPEGSGNSFKGYGVGVWAGFQNGSVPNTTTTISVRKVVDSSYEEYVDTAKFAVNVIVSGLQSTPSSLVGTTYNNGSKVRDYTGTLSGDTLTFTGVEMKNGYVFELAKDFLDAEKTSNVRVTVTETGETDGKFNALFPACATYIGIPQQTNDCTNDTPTAYAVGFSGD